MQQDHLLDVDFFFLITVKTCRKKGVFTDKVSTFLGKAWATFA